MTRTISQGTKYLRWAHEFLFSLYFALLLVSTEEARGPSWATELRVFYASHRYPNAPTGIDDNYRDHLAAFLTIWLIAGAVFLGLRLTENFTLTKTILRSFAGSVAIAGFPLACLYEKRGMFFLYVDLAIAAVCFALYIYRKWPVSGPVNVLLLLVHYALWSSFGAGYLLGGGPFLFWPDWRWAWSIWKVAWLAYPVLGFCSTLLWAAYRKHSEASGQHTGRPTL